jgi:hypothetical protein
LKIWELMRSAMDQGFILECFDTLRNMAYFAIFLAHITLYCCRVSCPGMFCSWPMADLTAGILEMRGFCEADKSAWLSIACGVTGIALLDLVRSKVSHLFLNTLK